MRPIDKELYEDALSFFNKWTSKIEELETQNLEEGLDCGYAIRESVEYINSVRVSLEKLSGRIQFAIALALLRQSLKSWKTSHVTGTVNTRMAATPPKKSTNEEMYFKLMDYFKIPREVSEKELVRIHYPAFEEYCTELAMNGEPPPAGINHTDLKGFPRITFRKRKGVLES